MKRILIIILASLSLLFIAVIIYELGFNKLDIVIENGQVIDPESGMHHVVNIGIKHGKIAVLSKEKLTGREIIDASQKYVVPGFIDILSYDTDYTGDEFKVADGVTTNLSLHGGTVNFSAWLEKQKKNMPMVNYGAAVSHMFMRNAVGVKSVYAEANPAQIKQMEILAENALKQGALAVSFSLEYTPGATTKEIMPLFKIAAEYKVPCFIHARYSDPDPPGTNEEAIDEIIKLALETGAACHIDHINSTGGTFTMQKTIAQIEAAHKNGADISACVYPYNYWATYLNSARFDEGWQKRFRIDYSNLQIPGTDEILTPETFTKYRAKGMVAVAYAIPEDDVITALKCPWIMIGSDCVIEKTGNSHPRGAGCFSRVISKYVREKQVLTLDDAIRKMTLLSARRLEAIAPAFKNKGRIKAGADADIVIFDYERIQDKATVANPRQYSEGIDYVFINGMVVKKGNEVFHKPSGKPILSINH
jgi:N-acyl-D-aspartate/D-glutamate deacylase